MPNPENIQDEIQEGSEVLEIVPTSEEPHIEEDTIYQITSFGADFLVDGIISRFDRGDIFIPDFQRRFVWTHIQASRFIESILLGLPIPGIFLYREENTGKHLVIDGLQRLTALHSFVNGYLPNSRSAFRLRGVKQRFSDLGLRELSEIDQRRFFDCAIHATIIQQNSPVNDFSSAFHVFERLNSGGTPLKPQEIRDAVYHGSLQSLIDRLNDNRNWRKIFGKPSVRSQDKEAILRFFALKFSLQYYKSPMKRFLNSFMNATRELDEAKVSHMEETFKETCEIVSEEIPKPFRPKGSFSIAIFDAVMVAIADNVENGIMPCDILERYRQLLENKEFIEASERATADATNVRTRVRIARSYMQ